jgi:hypothetical protein
MCGNVYQAFNLTETQNCVHATSANIYWICQNEHRKLKRGTTIAGQVQKSAPLYCEVKIICDGKEVTTETTADPTPPLSPSPVNNSSRSNNPTPPSSTPNHDKTAANGDRKDSEPTERKKITKFLRCFSLWLFVMFPFHLPSQSYCMHHDWTA